MATVTAPNVRSLEEEFAKKVEALGLNDQPAADRFAEKPEADMGQLHRMALETGALAGFLLVSNIKKLELGIKLVKLAAEEGLGGANRANAKSNLQNPLVAKNQGKNGFTKVPGGIVAGAAALTVAKTWPNGESTIQPTGGSLTNRTEKAQANESPRSLDAEAEADWWAAQINDNTLVAARLPLAPKNVVWLTLRKLQTDYPGALDRMSEYFIDKATADRGPLEEGTADMLKMMADLDGTGEQPAIEKVEENKLDNAAPLLYALKEANTKAQQQEIVQAIGEKFKLNENPEIAAALKKIMEEKEEDERAREYDPHA